MCINDDWSKAESKEELFLSTIGVRFWSRVRVREN